MALQPKIIACGKSVAIFSMAVRFLVGPAVMAATSLALGIRGVLLHVAIIQVNHPNLFHLKLFYLLILILYLIINLISFFLSLQAALPQAIVSFVFAKEYNVHPDILSTS